MNLVSNNLGHAGIAVSQGINSNPSSQVEVFSVLHIPEVTPLASDEHWGWSHIGLDHVWGLFVDQSYRVRASSGIGVGERCSSL
jgi:hypothetical protein